MSNDFIPFVLPRPSTLTQDVGSEFAAFPLSVTRSNGAREKTRNEQDVTGEAMEEAGPDVSVRRVDGRVSQIRVRCNCGKVLLLECRYEGSGGAPGEGGGDPGRE